MNQSQALMRWQDEPYPPHVQEGVRSACRRYRVGSQSISAPGGSTQVCQLTLLAEGPFSAFARGWVLIGDSESAGVFVETEDGHRFEIKPEEGQKHFNFEEALLLMARKINEAKAADFKKESP